MARKRVRLTKEQSERTAIANLAKRQSSFQRKPKRKLQTQLSKRFPISESDRRFVEIVAVLAEVNAKDVLSFAQGVWHTQTAARISEAIERLRGPFMREAMLTNRTQEVLSVIGRVSKTSVLRYLQGTKSLKPETAARVAAAIEEFKSYGSRL